MTQTEREWSTLEALLADNTSGQVSPQDIRDAFASAHGYGSLLLSASGAPAIVSTVTNSAFKLVDIYDSVTTQSSDVNVAGTSGTLSSTYSLTIGTTGIYYVSFFCSFSSSQNNDLVTFAPHVDGSPGLVEVARYVSTGGDTGSVAMMAVVPYTVGNVVDMRVKVGGTTANLTFLGAGLSTFRVG